MHGGKQKLEVPDCQLAVGEIVIKQVEKFSYLGSLITSDGISKAIFQKMGKVFKNRQL